MAKKMIDKKSWLEFQQAGLLWFVNRLLHVFGWAIVFEVDEEDQTKIEGVYPARVRFRGFITELEEKGFRRISEYMISHAPALLEEANE